MTGGKGRVQEMEAVGASFLAEAMRPEKWTKVCSDEGDWGKEDCARRRGRQANPCGNELWQG